MFHAHLCHAKDEANEAKNSADAVRWELNLIRRKTEAISLASQAMWELITERTNLTDADIKAKMQEIDLRDGSLDGKVPGSLEVCSSCGQKTNTVRKTCLYCGAALSGGSPFALR